MKNPDQKLILLLWAVIAVLVVGAAIGGFMLVHANDNLSTTNAELNGDVSSLRNQLQQAKAQIPSTSPTPSLAPSASPVATPEAFTTPTTTPKPSQ